MGVGAFTPGSPSKGGGGGEREGEEYEMIRLTDDFDGVAMHGMSRGD